MNSLLRRQIKADLQDDFAGVSRQIFQNWRTLESGGLASCVWLSSRIDRLYRDLGANPEFLHKVRQTENLATASKPYHWMPLFEHNNCRSSLLFLPPGGRVSMHDHPHSIGVSIVLEGTPQISQCDGFSTSGHSITSLATEKVSCKRLRPHQKSFIFPHKNNIHGFSSTKSPCLLLNTLFHKQAMHHHGLIPGRVINRSLSGRHLSSTLQKSLPGIFFSMSLTLSALVYADDTMFLKGDAAVASALVRLPIDTLERYALDGNVESQVSLARRYSRGDGVKKDLYRAGIWYRRAAEGGCAEAQYQIGVMLLDGEGMTEDSIEGFEWIFRASQADHVKATEVFNYLLANPAAMDC